MTAQLIRINAIMLVLFLEVVSVNLIGAFKSKDTVAAAADDIIGEWVDADQTRRIKITKNGSMYEGVLTTAPNAAAIGKKILNDLVYSNNEYTGKLYLPKRDAYYDCTVKLKNNNSMIIEGSMGFISKESTWTRTK